MSSGDIKIRNVIPCAEAFFSSNGQPFLMNPLKEVKELKKLPFKNFPLTICGEVKNTISPGEVLRWRIFDQNDDVMDETFSVMDISSDYLWFIVAFHPLTIREEGDYYIKWKPIKEKEWQVAKKFSIKPLSEEQRREVKILSSQEYNEEMMKKSNELVQQLSKQDKFR